MLNTDGSWRSLAGIALLLMSCGTPGVVEVQRVPHSTRPPPSDGGGDAQDTGDTDDAGPTGSAGSCPEGYGCMDIAALGYEATDQNGEPLKASCSKGASLTSCDDDDPSASCSGLDQPLCAHLKIAGQEIVSCGQRCTP